MENFKEFIGKDIIITIPKTVSWEEYEKELKDVEEKGMVINFKVAHFPKSKVGNKCYIVYDGNIVGWMTITGFEEKEFECETTGKIWKGKFIQRGGKFNRINPIPQKGFQGYKYFN